MHDTDLERRLRTARDCDAWVAVVAEFFTAHGLVFGHGTDNAGDEAYWLLRHLTGWRDIDWRAPPPDVVQRAVELATRRASSRKPLAYLLKSAWFAGLEFTVDERVLVPRSPLAEVIVRGFAPWCALKPGDRRYRVIVSNPPYVPAAEVAALPPEYRHEPEIGLASGETGFDAAERIVRGAASRLTPDGALFLEVGAGADAFAAAHPRLPLIAIEFEHGGDGVFVTTAAEIEEFLRER